MRGRRWGFPFGDVCGHARAMSVTDLAGHLARPRAREGHGVESVLDKLNGAMAEESAQAVALGGGQARPQFLSLLYGELELDPVAGGAHCKIAGAGHPLPLRLSPNGSMAPMADPQMLLGIDEDAKFHANSFRLAPGETLRCVTDGVTERHCGNWQLNDDDGLSEVPRGCVGLGATAVAERVRQAVHAFDTGPVDDLAVLVLEAMPVPAPAGWEGAEPGVRPTAGPLPWRFATRCLGPVEVRGSSLVGGRAEKAMRRIRRSASLPPCRIVNSSQNALTSLFALTGRRGGSRRMPRQEPRRS
ncbi:PP2C family protein-serine/threonine phosphatase [Streptomyces atratus]|uniref:PP2C family protein-serine/threonine phosphatase n=1 Tax=Streptomyces atratus TaxID=1893 RepID=UPI0033D9B5CA